MPAPVRPAVTAATPLYAALLEQHPDIPRIVNTPPPTTADILATHPPTNPTPDQHKDTPT